MADGNESSGVVYEQYPERVLNFSSQYGSEAGHNYNVTNICKEPRIYPSYGDSMHALVFRTYGPWWINLPSSKAARGHFPRPEEHFTSRDFIEIKYSDVFHTCESLNIYETYNPGTLEAVYAGREEEDGSITWHQVWKFPDRFSVTLADRTELVVENGHQLVQDLFPDHIDGVTSAMHSLNLNTDHQQISKIHTRHTYPPAARIPRVMKIPLKDKVPFPTRHVRLEFDHCTANYYIEIDTISLTGGLEPREAPPPPPATEELRPPSESASSMDLAKLPFDLLFQICSHLDLRSLVRLSSTAQHFRQQCLHPLQLRSLNLQPYWNGITNESIERFFAQYCSRTRYLSLAWTRSIHLAAFKSLLDVCADHLVQLDLACCQYLTKEYVEAIVSSCPKIEVLNFQNCQSLSNDDFLPLTGLHHLRSLNVYRTDVDFRTLLPLIIHNAEHLEHLNIGSCGHLGDTVGIVRLIFGRCSHLRSLDLWRAPHLRQNGYLSIVASSYNEAEEEARLASLTDDQREALAQIYSLYDIPTEPISLAHMINLSELDLGWTDPPAGFVQQVAQQAGRSLLKLYLTACRRICDRDLIAVSENCPKLRQLDMLGSNVITEESIESLLKRCPDLQFLDLSFCSRVADTTLAQWMRQYRSCFKRSYSPVQNADARHEFD